MNTPSRILLRLLLHAGLAAFVALPARAADAAAPAVAPFSPGTRWMLIGDSITQDGRYPEFVRLFLATRFPGRDISLLNAGISGDSLGGALRRYDWDIAPRRPTFATVMLGMNDVGRDNYQTGEPSANTLQKREDSLRSYRERLSALTTRLRADGAQVVLVTPSIFDDTATLPSANRPGCNTGLARCADIVREVAASAGVSVVDVHGPMTAFNLDRQRADPAFSLVGGDRIHPGPPGHLFIAGALLRGLGAPPVVSAVALDASRLAIVSAENAEVTRPVRDADGALRFTVHARSLPFPATADTKPGLALFAFADSLNRESLRVTGLPAGSYSLAIENTPIRVFTSEELAAGVRLDRETATPQHKQASAVARSVARWSDRVRGGLRAIAQVEHQQFGDAPRPLAFADTEARIREKLAALPESSGYQAKVFSNYLLEKPREAKTAEEIATYDAEIFAVLPRPLEYRLTRQ